eukprot:11932581-Karenia_brevis.AAC.1
MLDATKARLNSKSEEDLYIQLMEECGAGPGVCGKRFVIWVQAWLYTDKLERVDFQRGASCCVVLYHQEKDLSLVEHGDDFTFCGLEENLLWVRDLMES